MFRTGDERREREKSVGVGKSSHKSPPISLKLAGTPAYWMSALIYIYSTASYYSTVLPKGPLESYNKENLRTVSRLLQPPSSALLSPFGTEVSLYIHHTHCFIYRSLPDHLVAFIVLIDINPQNDLVELDYSLRTTISGQSKYFLHWDSLPCIIPHYLYKGLKSRAELDNLNTTHLLSELELWWGFVRPLYPSYQCVRGTPWVQLVQLVTAGRLFLYSRRTSRRLNAMSATTLWVTQVSQD